MLEEWLDVLAYSPQNTAPIKLARPGQVLPVDFSGFEQYMCHLVTLKNCLNNWLACHYTPNCPQLHKKSSGSLICIFWWDSIVRGLLGTGPPDPTLESASPSPPQGSIWHRFNIDSTSKWGQIRKSNLFRCRIDVKSMPNRTLRRGGRGGFEGGVWGSCA